MSDLSSWDNFSTTSKLDSFFTRMGTNRAFLYGGENYYFDLKCEEDYLLAYNSCPPLKSIIGKRAKAFNTGKFEVLNKNTGNYASGSLAKSIIAKLSKPNVLQTGNQFFAQQNIYIDIFGYCPMLLIRQ